jgi:DNA repair protein RadA/Sms
MVEETTTSARVHRTSRLGDERDQKPQIIDKIDMADEQRLSTRLEELDRVLGGGIVPGSIILVGGDPGIGKSTLILQTLSNVSQEGLKVLYVSGEESARQIKMRGNRMRVSSANLYVVTETSLEKIFQMVKDLQPQILAIDSIQTIYTESLESAPGSIGQVRETAGRLMALSKRTGISTFLIGHVTKEGALAGPKILEHMVDTVLYFEGNRGHPFRILRAVKNRFGSTNEIGVFEMESCGLSQVLNPSELFLSERSSDVPGSVVVPSIEGSRPILVELQALVTSSSLGVPRRTVIGTDYNRVSLLIAILEKRAGLNMVAHDIFVNVAGGVKVDEPAVDLGTIAAIASSFNEKPIASKTVVVGEVGLVGEIRAVNQVEIRIAEAEKLGFACCMLPKNNLDRLGGKVSMELIGVVSIKEALRKIF